MASETRVNGTSGTAGWAVRTLGGAATLSLSGEIDMAAVGGVAPGLAVKLLEAVDGAACVTCDLAEVGFMDSSGIHLLVKLRDEVVGTGRDFRLLRPGEQIGRIFDIVGAGSLFEIVEPSA